MPALITQFLRLSTFGIFHSPELRLQLAKFAPPRRRGPTVARFGAVSVFGIIRFQDQIACRRFLSPGGHAKVPKIHGICPLVAILVAARQAADIRQQALAKKLGRPQSFVSKFESGERRLDVVEFVAIARALDADPVKLFRDFVTENPPKGSRNRASTKAGV
jgi:Helix-turn-helix